MEELFSASITQLVPQVKKWRHHLHQHPELSFQEKATTEYIIEQIKNLPDLTYTRPSATGLVATLDTGKPGGTIALRADIDALPITEESGVPFSSQNPGVMHACGHDAHTAMLIGIVHAMCEHKAALKGKFVFIFQAAEEDPPGGAQELVDKGVLDGVDAIIGQHVGSLGKLGTIDVAPGYHAANTDSFKITVHGAGGHGSRPQQCLDPIPVAAEIVGALQQIVSRFVAPSEPAVVSVTYFQSGTTHNIIPNTAILRGTVRTYDQGVRTMIEEKIKSIAAGIAMGCGLSATTEYSRGYNALYNTEEYTTAFIKMTKKLYGDASVVASPPSMGGEDFSAYLTKVPGCFYHLGTASEKIAPCYVAHNSHFVIDEDAYPLGMNLMLKGALLFQKLAEAKNKNKE